MSAAIRLHDVAVAYRRTPAIKGVSGAFAAGSLTALAGPNGAGKSTLLKAIMGELPLAAGTIERSGLSPRDISHLPQAAEIDRSFPMTVADTVMLGAWRTAGAFRRVDAEAAERCAEAMATVDLEGLQRRMIGSLSTGQFQRVLFARLLVQDAPVVLLDEPFTAIDMRTVADLLQIIRTWHAAGRTVVAVLHDFEQVRAHFPETLLLARDQIAWGPTATVLTDTNLRRAKALAEGITEVAGREAQRRFA